MKILKEHAPGETGTSPVAAKITAGLDDPGLVFVFPTQISADSWAKASLDFSGRSCVDLDRFLGWDSLLRTLRANPPSPELREADVQSRLLWAYCLIEEEKKNPSLGRLINPSQTPPSGLAWGLASAAPSLFEAAASIRAKVNDGSLPEDQELIQDYEFLAANYDAFLRNHGIYEPARLPWRGDPEKRYLLFCPSLMPGFRPELGNSVPGLSIETWEPGTPGSAAAIGISPSLASFGDGPSVRKPLLLSFSSLRDELDYVFGVCRRLLDQGLPPSELALSLPSLGADLTAHVSRAARSWGLPLQYRGGRALSDSPIGRLLEAVARALGEGFSLRGLKNLFDPGLAAWKEREHCLSLIGIAKRYNIPEFSADPDYTMSLWSKTLGLESGQAESLPSFFQRLRKSCAALSGSRSFAALEIALHAFIDDLLDEKRFQVYGTLTLERIFEELSALKSWEIRLAGKTGALKPFEVLRAMLEHRLYSPADSAQAISVYPYHLGLMSAARLHFVLEASVESSSAAVRLLSRVPQEISPPKDEATLTDVLFDSMDLVKTVFCHAEQSLDGYSIAHPYFFRRSARRMAIETISIPDSPEAVETNAWEELRVPALPAKLPSLSLEAVQGSFKDLKRGLLGSPESRGAQDPRENQRRGGLPPPLFFDAESRLSPVPGPRPALRADRLLRIKAFDAAGLVKLNPRTLGYLALCPFRWFLSGIPGLEAEIADPAILAEGSLMHDMIRFLLEADGSELLPASGPGDSPSYEPPSLSSDRSRSSREEKIKNAFRNALQKTLSRSGYSLRLALESAYPKIQDRIGRILDYEGSLREEGWLRSDFERVLSMELPDLGLALEGRADRVVFRTARIALDADSSMQASDASSPGSPPGEGCLLIDYKRKRCPAKKEFLTDESGRIQDFQINAYAAMLESAGFPVLQAFYWSIEDNKPVAVFGSGKQRPDRASFEPERGALGKALIEASERIREGRFLEIKPSKQACSNCPVRAVCRIHFSAERS
jgi:hypothetical protein